MVEVTRGDLVESRHRGAAAIMNAAGEVIAAWGDITAPVYPRSAVKPLQAMPLIETGAAEHYGLNEREIALACASHRGTPAHVRAVSDWLAKVGLPLDALRCGAHPPVDPDARAMLERAGERPGNLHNNCSGKHSGFLTAAAHMGEPLDDYRERDHPVQRRVREVLSEMSGEDLIDAAVGTDGCGVPTVAMPLKALARAAARLADPSGLSATRQATAHRVLGAMRAHPVMVSGPGGFDTVAITAARGGFVTKGGAEGTAMAFLTGRGLGIALKIDDGTKRAVDAAMAVLLDHAGALDGDGRTALRPFVNAPLINFSGTPVGEIRAAGGWLS
jgi:L-asparaginase II